MDYKNNLSSDIFEKLNISKESKVYYSNIGFIIISDKKDFVYKIFNSKKYYKKELSCYELFKKNNILIPKIFDLGEINNCFILKIENVRNEYKRKEKIEDLDLSKVAKLIYKIHSIKKDGKSFLLGDVHVSNFFEINDKDNIEIGIFDFSSSYYGEIEGDISDIYIDINLDDKLLKQFIENYNFIINNKKLYKYTIKELYERIKNGMNLSDDIRKKYIKFLLKLKLLNND